MNNSDLLDIINRLTVEEKAGALMTLGFAGVKPSPRVYDFVEKFNCGGLRLTPETRTFGAYVDPDSGKSIMDFKDFSGIKYGKESLVARPSQYKSFLEDLQRRARNRNSGIPLHFSTDMEGGNSTDPLFQEFTYFPKPMALRATNDPDLAYEVALKQGQQIKALGINWIHSPVLDVNTNPLNPEIYNRSYSDSAEDVLEYAKATSRGFRDAGIITCGKHFPGRGSGDVDAHFEEPIMTITWEDLHKIDLLPYIGLMEAGLLPSIMIAHSIYADVDPGKLATVSRKIVTDLLRKELKYEGVITSDSMTMGGIINTYGVAEGCVQALKAGVDLVLMKAETVLVEETHEAIEDAIRSGKLDIDEVDEKIYRVLKMKNSYGLFDETENETDPDAFFYDTKLHALAKNVAEKSLCVLKEDGVMPLAKDAEKVLVIEQKNKSYRLLNWHSGMIYERIQETMPQARYLETDFSYTEMDRQNILTMVQDFDTLIFTSFFLRGNRSNLAFLKEIIDDNPDKDFIFISNTPYETLSIPSNAKNVLVTFSTAPDCVLNAADYILGKGKAEGTWPLHGTNKVD